MARKVNINKLYTAAHLDFMGVPRAEIKKKVNVCLQTLTNWSKRQEWIDLQKELIEKRKAELLNAENSIENAS